MYISPAKLCLGQIRAANFLSDLTRTASKLDSFIYRLPFTYEKEKIFLQSHARCRISLQICTRQQAPVRSFVAKRTIAYRRPSRMSDRSDPPSSYFLVVTTVRY